MQLRIVAPSAHNEGFLNGALAHVWLDGKDVSMFVQSISVEVVVDKPISATLTFYPSAFEFEGTGAVGMAVRA